MDWRRKCIEKYSKECELPDVQKERIHRKIEADG